MGPGYAALPGFLRHHSHHLPYDKSDTSFARGHQTAAGESFFDWLQSHPENSRHFHDFMKVHRTGTQTWLDHPEVLNRVIESFEKGKSGNSQNDDQRVLFVDVGGGMGHQCDVSLVKSYRMFWLTSHRLWSRSGLM
jgi:demethylsterigmatocystin 6-O-methyltransferase